MTLEQYQREARKTAIYPASVIYPTLGLAGEAGEVAEKVKKVLRDNAGEFTAQHRELLLLELGDVLWYVANLAGDLDISLEVIAEQNLEKLRSRQQRGVLGGSGDKR